MRGIRSASDSRRCSEGSERCLIRGVERAGSDGRSDEMPVDIVGERLIIRRESDLRGARDAWIREQADEIRGSERCSSGNENISGRRADRRDEGDCDRRAVDGERERLGIRRIRRKRDSSELLMSLKLCRACRVSDRSIAPLGIDIFPVGDS